LSKRLTKATLLDNFIAFSKTKPIDMKIIHIAAQNVTGTLNHFVKGHQLAGHEARFLTFFPNRNRFAEDICLDLPFVGPANWLVTVKKNLQFNSMSIPITGNQKPKTWQPGGIEKQLFALRERIWRPRIERAAAEFKLWDFDIYHLDGGVSFYRDGRDLRQLKKQGKGIVTYYHGLDLRVRGKIPAVHALADRHFTCEFDLYQQYRSDMNYLFLPFDVEAMPLASATSERVRICHAPRLRSVKGSETIIAVVNELAKSLPVELVLIENMTHAEALKKKQSCHISIDQIARGDMGYGVNSLESLAMGIPTVTHLSADYQKFIADHPFVLADRQNLAGQLRRLITSSAMRNEFGERGRQWVSTRHDFRRVAAELHSHYRDIINAGKNG
jgi:glycosyltransferase involved in cell wall biosynthesis